MLSTLASGQEGRLLRLKCIYLNVCPFAFQKVPHTCDAGKIENPRCPSRFGKHTAAAGIVIDLPQHGKNATEETEQAMGKEAFGLQTIIGNV